MGGQLDSKIGEVGGQLHRELGKVVVERSSRIDSRSSGGAQGMGGFSLHLISC